MITDIIFNWSDKIDIILNRTQIFSIEKYRIWEVEQQLWKKLTVGAHVEFAELDNIVKYIRKNKYNNWSRQREIDRINLVKSFIVSHIPEVKFENIWFGVWSTEIIYEHPVSKWGPDIKLLHPLISFYIEVTWKQWCWRTLRVRPDKLEFYRKNSIDNARIAHTCDREWKLYFIKIDNNLAYTSSEIEIAWSKEKMVLFEMDHKAVYSSLIWIEYLKKKIELLKNNT